MSAGGVIGLRHARAAPAPPVIAVFVVIIAALIVSGYYLTFLEKPFTSSVLARKVRDVLDTPAMESR